MEIKFKKGDIVITYYEYEVNKKYVVVKVDDPNVNMECFSGTCINTTNDNYDIGEYVPDWYKRVFKVASKIERVLYG